nr:hypothetical protein [uncultured Brevundimonas sp.]
MIRMLSLTAALALLPLSTALAHEAPPAPGSAEARLQAASSAFEQRMERFGQRAEALSADDALSEPEKRARISALWAEYSPDVAAFTAEATRQASRIAAEALKDIDVNALVSEALNDPDVQEAMQSGAVVGDGIARNSAWTNPSPEQMETYGLIAQYALNQAQDVVALPDPAEDAAMTARPAARTP